MDNFENINYDEEIEKMYHGENFEITKEDKYAYEDYSADNKK